MFVISYLGRAVIKAHLVAHLLTQPDPHLMRHPLGYSDGCNPPGLSHTNLALPAKTWTETEASWRGMTDPAANPIHSKWTRMSIPVHQRSRVTSIHTCFVQVLRELSGFSAASFTRYDQEGVFLYSLNEFVFVLINRQLFWFMMLRFTALLYFWHVWSFVCYLSTS